MTSAKQKKAQEKFKRITAKARKKGLKPFTKAYGAFIKKEFKK